MTNRESAEHTVKTLAIESCEQWLNFKMSEGVRAAIPGTNKLIMVGRADWIAKNVPDVEVLIAAAEQPTGDLTEKVRAAMIRAYDLGQKYWKQADSEYESEHKKADVTAGRFIEVNDELCAAIAAHLGNQSQAAQPSELATQLRDRHAREIWDWDILLDAAKMIEHLAGQSQATKAQAVPKGFALVPIEPTQEMFTAARTSTSGSNTEKLLMASYWRNMLAAAPTAQEGVVTSCEGTPQQAAKAENFADWLKREMPPGTVISDPAWWAPRIHRAVSLDLAPTTSTVSAPDEIRNAALEEAAVACFCAVANRRPVYAKDCVELIRALKRTVSAPDGANGSASE